MSFVLMLLVAGLIVFIVAAPLLGFARQSRSSLRLTTVLAVAGISLSVIRIACYLTLFHQARTGQRDISTLPLALLLIPEGIVLPESGEWTIVQGILFSGQLTIGSFLWAALLGWSMTRRAGKVS